MRYVNGHIFIANIPVTSSKPHCIRKQYEFNGVAVRTFIGAQCHSVSL